jgi:hypothetical protein
MHDWEIFACSFIREKKKRLGICNLEVKNNGLSIKI